MVSPLYLLSYFKRTTFSLSVDRSTKGHILGVPQKSIAERDLSPATVSLLRIILHSAMLVSASRQPEVTIKNYKRENKMT